MLVCREVDPPTEASASAPAGTEAALLDGMLLACLPPESELGAAIAVHERKPGLQLQPVANAGVQQRLPPQLHG